MRTTHQHDTLHRIECWTGEYFRPAALREVGVYILIKHYPMDSICATLKFNVDNLEEIQKRNDTRDQEICRDIQQGAVMREESYPIKENTTIIEEPAEDEETTDAMTFFEMDRLRGDAQTATAPTATATPVRTANVLTAQTATATPLRTANILTANIPTATTATASALAAEAAFPQNIPREKEPSEIPTGDALNNPYCRIVHINGIHHLAVVSCMCNGEHQLPIDLVHSGFIPSTFIKIRTVFTTKVLDMFRWSNLELKASAYQYFQLLQRLTEKAAVPSPNLYNDLRKVSRAWRWMKKLKWAGYAYKDADPMQPAAGEMAVFCPACPQPNINLPSDWKYDINRYAQIKLIYI